MFGIGSVASSETYYRDSFSLPIEDLHHIVKHVRSWNALRGKRISLTGASGFVGTWLVESFSWANQHMQLDAHLTTMPGGQFKAGCFDFAIHAAKADTYSADVELTKRALTFARDSGVTRFLYTSSGAVSVGQQTEYARAKRDSELLCFNYAIVARLFAFVGPRLPINANFAVGNFIRDVIAGGPVIIRGDGTARRAYLYAADLAVWLWTLLLEGSPGAPYEVGGSETISISDLAELVVQNTVPGTPIVTACENVAGVSLVYAPSAERPCSELLLQPLISLPEGIRRMFAWNLDTKNRETASRNRTSS